MSLTYRELRFGITVQDPDHWRYASRVRADSEPGTGGYDDWVVHQLNAAMRAAGQKFIDAHPDLFACELT